MGRRCRSEQLSSIAAASISASTTVSGMKTKLQQQESIELLCQGSDVYADKKG